MSCVRPTIVINKVKAELSDKNGNPIQTTPVTMDSSALLVRDLDNNCLLQCILKELQILNKHLEQITDTEILEDEVTFEEG